ncbi:hypothetical protein BDA96_03G237100 [Sorghum bicolor]|uniref:Uncharacterized protein n=2 Tax=Sorghum bicolor TaxID=4558 RepID=A0A921UPE8_SORBI|nr:hypothetical protein BDA96_03G237100 [Sorghum bicolor]OQU87163.1 hypothetical protein SORBI_3003G218950 [Sorghum bicolor]
MNYIRSVHCLFTKLYKLINKVIIILSTSNLEAHLVSIESKIRKIKQDLHISSTTYSTNQTKINAICSD